MEKPVVKPMSTKGRLGIPAELLRKLKESTGWDGEFFQLVCREDHIDLIPVQITVDPLKAKKP